MVCLEPTSGPTSLALKAEAVIARIEGLFDKQAAHQPPSTGRGVRLPSAPLAAVVDQTRDATVGSSAHHPYEARNRPAAGQGSATASPAEVPDAAPGGRAVEVSRRHAGVLVTALIARRPMRSVATAERSRIRERSVGSPLPTYRATAT
jgi:hypothetical protein